MNPSSEQHVLASLVARFVAAAELDDEARALVTPAHTPRSYIDVLRESALPYDAIKFLAHLLPRREAVWWAWICVRSERSGDSSDERRVALEATERWIRQPGEENRRAAMSAAEAAGYETPAGCVALAAFFSGGSMAPVGQPEVPPPTFGAARAVFGSIVLAAVANEPEKAPVKVADFLSKGLELGDRIELWDTLAKTASGHVSS